MRRELANSGLTEEEILAKTMLLQKAMAGDNSPAFVNKTLRNALNAANVTPEELTKVERITFCQRTGQNQLAFDWENYRLQELGQGIIGGIISNTYSIVFCQLIFWKGHSTFHTLISNAKFRQQMSCGIFET